MKTQEKPALLVIHAGALGDLVCLFPVLKALGSRFPSLTLLGQSAIGEFAAGEGLVQSWLAIESAWTAGLFAGEPGPEVRRRLAAFSDVLAFSRSQALEAALRRIGLRACLAPPRPPPAEREHISRHALRAVCRCGLLQEAGLPSLDRTGSARSQAAASKTVLLHPGAGSRRKRWPLPAFLATAERLADLGFAPEVILGPAEDDLAARLQDPPRPVQRLRDLPELAARLRAAAGYIGNDSGASHLAGWLGLPSVVIFGPSDPARWKPGGPRVEALRPPLDCAPCFEAEEENCAASDCLARITPEDVIEAFGRLIAAGPR